MTPTTAMSAKMRRFFFLEESAFLGGLGEEMMEREAASDSRMDWMSKVTS